MHVLIDMFKALINKSLPVPKGRLLFYSYIIYRTPNLFIERSKIKILNALNSCLHRSSFIQHFIYIGHRSSHITFTTVIVHPKSSFNPQSNPQSNSQLPTSYSQLPTPNFQLPTSNFQLPAPNFQLPTNTLTTIKANIRIK